MNIIPKDNRDQVALLLGAIVIVAMFQFNAWLVLLHVGSALLTGWALETLFLFFKEKKWMFPHSASVTCLLIGLILSVNSPWWAPMLTAALAIGLKHIIHLLNSRHIFNPASLGLVVWTLLFKFMVVWWGVAGTPWIIVPLVVIMPLILKPLRRLWLPIGFIVVYWLYLIIKIGPSGVNLFLDPTIFLFAWVMVPEPQTSPIKGPFKYTFGILVALLTILNTELHIVWGDPLLNGLLAANLLSAIWLAFHKPKVLVITS